MATLVFFIKLTHSVSGKSGPNIKTPRNISEKLGGSAEQGEENVGLVYINQCNFFFD